MNLLLTWMLCASATIVDGRGDDVAVMDGRSMDAHVVESEPKRYKDAGSFRGHSSTGSRDDGIVVRRQAEEELDAWMDGLEFESRGNGRCT